MQTTAPVSSELLRVLDRRLSAASKPGARDDDAFEAVRCLDAIESHRAAKRADKDATDTKWHYRYPLIEWGMDQQDCQRVLDDEGFPEVEKSSCFFCPAMKRWEIRRLERQHPDLLHRALHLESVARPGLREKEGLGGHFAWADYLRQPELPFGACEVGGGPELCDSCYDGD